MDMSDFENDVRIYKVFIIEHIDSIHIDIFTFNVVRVETSRYDFDIIHKEDMKELLDYIKYNDYENIVHFLTSYYIGLLNYKYYHNCMFCISTKDYTFNFTLNEIKTMNTNLYEEETNGKESN